MGILNHVEPASFMFIFIFIWASALQQNCPILTFDANLMTRKEIYDKCFFAQQPCIIENALEKFPAWSRWRDPLAWKEKYGSINISYADRGAIVLTAGGYSTSISSIADFLTPTVRHREGKESLTDTVFAFFKDIKENNSKNSSLFNLLNNDVKTELLHHLLLHFFPSQAFYYNTKFLSLGNEGSGISFHVHGDTMLALIRGKKTWYVYGPGSMPSKVSKTLDVLH